MWPRKRGTAAIGLIWTTAVLLVPTSGHAAKRPNVPVPPGLEIEVLDPNADPLGNPAVELRRNDSCCRGKDDDLIVDIPPVVVVHKYYYTGDRSFQGPTLPGGPSIVVMNHPKTGQRCYVPVQMLPGAPRVHYSEKGIEYDYGRYGISVEFGLFGKPKVDYRNHVPVMRRAKEAAAGIAQGTGRLAGATKVPKLAQEASTGAKNAVTNVGYGVIQLAGRVAAPAVRILQATPVGSVFQSNPERSATRRRDCQVRHAACESYRTGTDVPTLR
jgi:hypothetical protein